MAAATAAQKAPTRQNAPQKQSENKEETKLSRVTRPVGIGIMVVLLALALVIGNGRALSRATPKAFLSQGDVASLVAERVTSAKNAETVAKRANLDASYYTEVENAARTMETARSARAVSQADQALASAVGDMAGSAAGALSGGDPALLTGAMDTFNDAGNLLRYEARSYNEKAEKAQKVYDGLLLKAFFARPDYYEGI